MPTLTEIEGFTAAYADRRRALVEAMQALERDVAMVRTMHVPLIRGLVVVVAALQDELATMIETSPELFERPRTRVMHGVKVGLTKAKGTVEWDDEAAVIRRIRSQLPAEQAEMLIRVRESVHKPAVYDLTAGDLKRLGIRIVDDGDVPVIRTTDGDIDKLVAALLTENETEPAVSQ